MYDNKALTENEETVKEEPVELTELFSHYKKTVTLADTITFQLILLVITAIGYVLINTFLPEISNDMYNSYISQTHNSESFGVDSVKQVLSQLTEDNTAE
jgi:hypothetical protein